MQRHKVEIGSPDGSPGIKRSDSLDPIANTTILSVPQRPSSPRQFFERLYGHLETRSSENGEIDVGTHAHKPPPCDTPYHSDGGSVSSPDISISDERTSLAAYPAYDFYGHAKDYPQHPSQQHQQSSSSPSSAAAGAPETQLREPAASNCRRWSCESCPATRIPSRLSK